MNWLYGLELSWIWCYLFHRKHHECLIYERMFFWHKCKKCGNEWRTG